MASDSFNNKNSTTNGHPEDKEGIDVEIISIVPPIYTFKMIALNHKVM